MEFSHYAKRSEISLAQKTHSLALSIFLFSLSLSLPLSHSLSFILVLMLPLFSFHTFILYLLSLSRSQSNQSACLLTMFAHFKAFEFWPHSLPPSLSLSLPLSLTHCLGSTLIVLNFLFSFLNLLSFLYLSFLSSLSKFVSEPLLLECFRLKHHNTQNQTTNKIQQGPTFYFLPPSLPLP